LYLRSESRLDGMPKKGKAPKQRRRRLDPQEKLVQECVQLCWAEAELEEIECSHLVDVCAGMGTVYEASVRLSSGQEERLMVKLIKMEECGSEDESQRLQRLESYQVEANFYEKGYAAQLNASGAQCPLPLRIAKTEDGSHLCLCMTKLQGVSAHRLSASQAEAAVIWLARLHAAYWGKKADVAIAEGGLHLQGCFWHLDSRAEEHTRMLADGWVGRLKLAARGIDVRLKADPYQTIVHGDAKAENMVFSGCAANGITAGVCDFQYVGKAHPAKDLAYCFLSLDKDIAQEQHTELLSQYLASLSTLLEAQGDIPPSLHELQVCYGLCVCDYARWVAGWGLLGFESILRRRCAATLDAIDGGTCLSSEGAYTEAIFTAFPL